MAVSFATATCGIARGKLVLRLDFARFFSCDGFGVSIQKVDMHTVLSGNQRPQLAVDHRQHGKINHWLGLEIGDQ